MRRFGIEPKTAYGYIRPGTGGFGEQHFGADRKFARIQR